MRQTNEERRGEIRGGRFVAGFSGEQFALPDPIGFLRETRRRGDTGTWIAVSGADPLNLAGILTPGPKIAALAGNRVLYRDGVPMASLVAGEATMLRRTGSGSAMANSAGAIAWCGACSIAYTRDGQQWGSGPHSCASFTGDMTVETIVARARFQDHTLQPEKTDLIDCTTAASSGERRRLLAIYPGQIIVL